MDKESILNSGIVNNDKFGEKDFENFAYFVSKAKNHTVIVKPQVEELLASGEIKVAKDESGKEMLRVAIEFHNGMIKFEYEPKDEFGEKVDMAKKTMNKIKIDYLRRIVLKEKDLPEAKKSIKEVVKTERTYTESEVKKMLEEAAKNNHVFYEKEEVVEEKKEIIKEEVEENDGEISEGVKKMIEKSKKLDPKK